MNFNIAFHSDVGLAKQTNQDSCCIYTAKTNKGNLLFSLICDGMGGLSKGELASAALVRVFSEWFEKKLPLCLAKQEPLQEIHQNWDRIIKEQNQIILKYGERMNIQLGTTLTALMILENGASLIGHVGDTRVYRIRDDRIDLLTEDQTWVAYEVRAGRLTPQAAAADPRRNVLLQCVGASQTVEPAYYTMQACPNECYMLCSDGFRHVVTEAEIQYKFAPLNNPNESMMKNNMIDLINLNKYRNENDNITAVLIKTI